MHNPYALMDDGSMAPPPLDSSVGVRPIPAVNPATNEEMKQELIYGC